MSISRRTVHAAALAALATAASSLSFTVQAQGYPSRDVNAVIQWGAGGGTDVAMRGYAPHAEEALGKKIVMQNKTGGSGAVGAAYVLQQPADGYTLLMGAEPQSLFRVMDLADFDYDKFYPINIAGVASNIILVANNNTPWKTFKELLDHVQKNPGKVKQYMAGTGTVPFTVSAMITSQTQFPVTNVQFQGDGPALAALQGGHVDIGFIASGASIEHVKAGRLKALAVLSTKPFEGIAPMTETLPGLSKYIPWGSWYGVFVRKETPDEAKAKLVAAFKKAGDNPQYRAMMEGRGVTMLNVGGAEAEDFIRKWQSTTAWLYHSVGAAKKDPASLGIAKP